MNRKKLNRKKKLVIAVASGLGLVVIGVALSAVLHLPWGSYLSHWPQVPPPELYVIMQPKQEDIPGIYELLQQTITTNGLAVLEGRPCQLDLRPDGSFTATNYPQWSPDDPPHVTAFTSTTGRWRCDQAYTLYNRHACWGILFSDSSAGIDSLDLRSKGAPYDLMYTYGDGDDGAFMLFRKKR